MSIQLTLDGHSFSAHGLDGEFPGEEPVEAELLTARTMLVPEEVLGTGDAGTLLAANGMAPAAEERAVCSLPVQGIVAVMAAHREALRQAEEKLGDRILYTTPRSGRCRPEHRPYGHTARRGSYILRCTTAASASRG
ncbi:MAG: hypothetical protein ACLRQT_03595 [Alistipes sp.]